MSQRQRLSWIDMARGYGILLVMIGHLGLPAVARGVYVQAWIYSFHLPMFFFLSGYLFTAEYKLKDFAVKMLRKLVLPYAFLCAVIVAVYAVVAAARGTFTPGWLFRLLTAVLIQRRFLTVWFLACLLTVHILMYALVKLLRRDFPIAVGAAVLAAAAVIYYHFGGTALPWNADAAFAAVPFFCGGWLLRRHGSQRFLRKRSGHPAVFILCAVLNIAAGALNAKLTHTMTDMYRSRYGIYPLMLLAAFAGIAAVLLFSRRFTLQPIRYLGENALVYFGWHQTVVMPLAAVLFRYMGFFLSDGDSVIKALLYRAAVLVLSLAVLTVVTVIINKTKLRYLLGKRDESKVTTVKR